MHGDDFGDCERTLYHGFKLVVHVHIIPVARIGASGLFRRIDGIDARVVFVRIARWLDVGIFAFGPRFLPLGLDP